MTIFKISYQKTKVFEPLKFFRRSSKTWQILSLNKMFAIKTIITKIISLEVVEKSGYTEQLFFLFEAFVW